MNTKPSFRCVNIELKLNKLVKKISSKLWNFDLRASIFTQSPDPIKQIIIEVHSVTWKHIS